MYNINVPRWIPRWLVRWFVVRRLVKAGFRKVEAVMIAEAFVDRDIPERKGG